MTFQTMDDRESVAFVNLRRILHKKINDEIGEAKLGVIALKGSFGQEADSELDIVAYHLGRGSCEKAEHASVNFRGIIGDCQPPRDRP